MQEAAQLLAGKSVPAAILEALLSKAQIPGNVVALVNTTPYDTWLEKTCMKWDADHPGQKIKLKTLSISKSQTIVEYCQKAIALQLLEDATNCISAPSFLKQGVAYWAFAILLFRLIG